MADYLRVFKSEDGPDRKKIRFFVEKTKPEPEQDDFAQSLEAVVGSVDKSVLEKLRKDTNGNAELAINLVLDGNVSTGQNPVPKKETNNLHVGQDVKPDSGELPRVETPPKPNEKAVERGLVQNWTRRYVGSFQAEVWATRAGRNIVKYGEKLSIERQNSSSNGSRNKEDIIVRVINSKGQDFARLAEADARMAAVLIDTGVASFDATCIFADNPLTLGSYVIIQVNCFILRTAFAPLEEGRDLLSVAKKGTSSSSWFDNARETYEERILSLRQRGLAQLFQRVGLGSVSDKVQNVDVSPDPTPSPSEGDDEVAEDQLNMLYRNSAPADAGLPETDPPADRFRFTLRPYQKRGLHWMIQKESLDTDEDTSHLMHPLWQAIEWPDQTGHEEKTSTPARPDTQTEFYANMFNGEMSLRFPSVVKSIMGGILADEMGLGKTISTMALVHSVVDTKPTRVPRYAANTTLVVAPMSLLSQWESEALACSQPGKVKVYVYYGNNSFSFDDVMVPSDVPRVVVTSYGTVMAEHTSFSRYCSSRGIDPEDEQALLELPPSLFTMRFFRVVIDEAHTIKNRATKTAKSCFALRADRKWALTGTPIVNKLEDLYSLVKFLRIEPWCNFKHWKAFVTTPFLSKGYVQALSVVQSILEPIVLRRTKDMKQKDGTPLVELPPKTVSIERVQFSDNERALYNYIFAHIKSSVVDSLSKGRAMTQYTTILMQILRLRQTCCHPLLVWNKSKEDPEGMDDQAGSTAELEERQQQKRGGASLSSVDAAFLNQDNDDLREIVSRFESANDESVDARSYGVEVMRSIIEGAEHECPICTTEPIPASEQAVTECWHMACLSCLLQHIQFQQNKGQVPRCFACRATISADKLYQVQRGSLGDGDRIMLKRYRQTSESSKVRALVRKLEATGTAKSVVFSQFTSYLDLIERSLHAQGIKTLRFDGTMSHKQRAEVLKTFREDASHQVLLLSLKTGGVGLNLTCARYAFLMDPWWSFAVEAQAIDRVHRMGQVAPVEVTRFIVEGTVEERMLRIQDRKMMLAATLGMSEEEKRAQRLEDIKMLFDE